MESSFGFKTLPAIDRSETYFTESQHFDDASELKKFLDKDKILKRSISINVSANTYIEKTNEEDVDYDDDGGSYSPNSGVKSELSNVFEEDVDQDQIKENQNKATNLLRKFSAKNDNSKDDIFLTEGENEAENGAFRRRMSSCPLKSLESNTIEENLRLEHLKKLKKIFIKRRKFFILDQKSFKSPDHLNKDEFVQILSSCLNYVNEDEIAKLFKKLDTQNTGSVTWSEFCGYLMNYFSQKAFSESLKVMPFNSEPKIRHSPHNRLEVTAKILSLNNPLKFINISRTGAIGIWNKNLTLHKRFRVDPSIHDQPLFLPKTTNSKYTTWVTDAITLSNVHKLVISTSGRELRFFSISHEHCIEEFVIYGLEYVPTCLDYWYDDTSNSNQSMLFIGDECGNIEILNFPDAANSLYDSSYKSIKGVTKIYWAELKNHSNFVNRFLFKSNHTEAIRKLKYIRASNTIISASSDAKASIVICDLDYTRKPYIFQLNKGCLCFDYSKKLNLLVTGSSDSLVRLWDMYVTANPTTRLSGHKTMVIDVKIHEHFDYLYSYSSDGALYVWDLVDSIIIQKLNLNFPSIINSRVPEYGAYPMHLYSEPDNPKSGLLLIACDDYMASISIGSAAKATYSGPVSHSSPITTMVYSPLLKQVVTGSDDSTLTFWNLDNGQQILSVKNAHGDEEITSMGMDKTQRRLFTGARDGTIKVWNMVNGCNIQNYLPTKESEVTGIVYNSTRKMVISVGWSRKIVTYFDESQENFTVKPRSFSINLIHHEDDILCADSCTNMLATASYDGEINVWNTDTEKLIVCLQKPTKTPNAKPRKVQFDHQSSISSLKSKSPFNDNLSDKKIPPVDKLLFLKHRASKYGLSVGLLVSSQNGMLSFWSFYANQKCLSSFYSSNFPNESVLSLCTDEENCVLVAGDSRGFVYIWDIENHATKTDVCYRGAKRINAWRCHDSSIVSCQYVDSSTSSYSVDLIITASTDLSCKLWTINGKLIGTFGQRGQWNVRNERTYAYFNPFEISDEDGERVNVMPVLEAIASFRKLIERTESGEESNEFSDKDTSNNFSKIFGMSGIRRQSRMTPNQIQVPRYDYLSSIEYLKFKKEIVTSNDYKDLKNLKLDTDEIDKTERRKKYSEIDQKLVLRLPNICTPYVSLKMPVLNEFDSPKSFPVTETMKSYGFKLPSSIAN